MNHSRASFSRAGALILALVLALAAALCLLSACNASSGSKEEEGGASAVPQRTDLAGLWVYDEHTTYEFRASGKGCMTIDGREFDFSYTVSGDQLSIDFVPQEMYDCVYTHRVEDDTLTLIGGEGTVGGTYTLKRS